MADYYNWRSFHNRGARERCAFEEKNLSEFSKHMCSSDHQIQTAVTMEADCVEDVPITFVSDTEVISNFCRINYRLLRKAYETGSPDLSYLSAKESKDPGSEVDEEDDESNDHSSEDEQDEDEQEQELIETETEFESDNESSFEEDSETDEYQCRGRSTKRDRSSASSAQSSRKETRTGPVAGRSRPNSTRKEKSLKKSKDITSDRTEKSGALSVKDLNELLENVRQQESKILDLKVLHQFLEDNICLSSFPDRKKMVESITTDPMKTELQKLVKFMFSQIESIFLDCGKRKIARKDKRAAFAHECAQDLLNFRDAGTPHFEVWSQLMEASAMERSRDSEAAIRSELYWYLYENFHSAILTRKDSNYNEMLPARNVIKEDIETIYRFSGFTLQSMIKLREETIKGVKGRKKVTKATKEKMQKELDVLEKLKLPPSEKSVLPAALQILDEGRLTFFRPYLIPALENIDSKAREFLNPENAERYPSQLIKKTQDVVFNDQELKYCFIAKVNDFLGFEVDSDTISSIFFDIVHKMVNTRTKEFMLAWKERQSEVTGKAVDTDQSLRDKLKTFSSILKR